jgi:serine acetyltransferase
MKQLAKNTGAAPIPQQSRTGVVLPFLSEFNKLFHGQMGDKISKDIDIAHLRRRPDRPMNQASRLWLLAASSGLRLMLIHRISRWLRLKRELGGWRSWFWLFMSIPFKALRLAVKINTKSEIDSRSEIEGGVCFSDQGHIVFGSRKTGAGTVIGPRVTIGVSHVNNECPEIGKNVWIGSDCVVYGAITIGDGATLLPGTVLAKSIPPCVVMRGNPARLVVKNFDNSELRVCQDIDAIQYVNAKLG